MAVPLWQSKGRFSGRRDVGGLSWGEGVANGEKYARMPGAIGPPTLRR